MNNQTPVSKRNVLQACRECGKYEIKAWFSAKAGHPVTEWQFKDTLRALLPKEPFFQKEVMEAIKDGFPDAVVWKNAAGSYSRRGIPDITAIIEGHYFGFEVKRPFIGELSKIQQETIKEINKAGGTAMTVSFGKEALEVILSWMKRRCGQ